MSYINIADFQIKSIFLFELLCFYHFSILKLSQKNEKLFLILLYNIFIQFCGLIM